MDKPFGSSQASVARPDGFGAVVDSNDGPTIAADLGLLSTGGR
ncbi:hypothetical protein [Solicola sp. PLA-1-18]